MKKITAYLDFDSVLLVLLLVVLALNYLDFLKFSYWKEILIGVAILATIPVVASAFDSLRAKKINIDTLAGTALIFAILNLEWISVIFINLMLTSSRIFLSYNERRARKSIEGLLKLKPKRIKVKGKDGKITEVTSKGVKVGDIVIVGLGERVPVDGTVVSGAATLDESSLTGESMPVAKSKGDEVFSSTLVVSGELEMKTEKIGAETTLEKIIALVEKAQLDKPEIRTTAEKFAGWYITITFIGAGIAYAVTGSLGFVLAIMLVVCADDIAVAVPLAFLTAISYAAKRGIIIKGARFIEVLKDVKVIFVDKTGTLTKGKLKVEKFICSDAEKKTLLTYSGAAAALSGHPISKAIGVYSLEEMKTKSAIEALKNFKEVEGNGLCADIKGVVFCLGKLSYVEKLGVKIDEKTRQAIQSEEDNGYNVTLIALGSALKGYFVLADEVKISIKKEILALRGLGVERVIMLTGDNPRVAKRISETLGITEFYAELLPAQKLDFIKKTLSPNYKTMMIGDGINDAAALSLADIGVAMGGIGLDVTIESADIVLMRDDFSQVPKLLQLSELIVKISNQDFIIWGITNLVGLGIVFAGLIGPTGAAAYNFLTDFLPLVNSTRVFGLYLKDRKAKS